MTRTLFFSGQYEKWEVARHVGVPKKCGRILIRGLANAMRKSYQFAELKINGTLKEIIVDGDRLILTEILGRGNYWVEFKITYNNLEKTKWL